MIDQVLAPFRYHLTRRISPEAADLVGVGSRHSWNFRLLTKAPLLAEPAFLENWWFVPVEQDTSAIPEHAQERVRAIYEAGLRPKGFVIAHEAPALLAAPARAEAQAPSFEPLAELRQLLTRPLIIAAGVALFVVVIGPLLLKLLVTLVTALVTVLAVPLLLGTALLVDPVLIAVTEDGYWVEIDRWWT